MNRAPLLCLLIGGLAVLGMVLRDGGLLALALPPLAYLGAGLLARPQPPQVRAARTLSATCVSAETPVDVELVLTNDGPLPVDVALHDTPPSDLAVAGITHVRGIVVPGGELRTSYTLSGSRGRHRFGAVQVSISEPLALFAHQQELEVNDELLVLPPVARLRSVPIRPRRTRPVVGPTPARRAGDGIDFFGVRPYRTGDPLRRINERVSARYAPALFVDDFEREQAADVVLVLDVRRGDPQAIVLPSTFARAVEMTAALAAALLDRGHRVGLLQYGRSLDWIVPGYGRVQRERVLRALGRAELHVSEVFDRIEALPTRLFPARAQIILVSPLHGDEPTLLTRLRARRFEVLVVSPAPSDVVTGLAAQIAATERTLMVARVRAAGVFLIDWAADRTAAEALDRAHLG